MGMDRRPTTNRLAVTGTKHPFIRRIREQSADVEAITTAHTGTAVDILAHHRDQGQSNQGVYRVMVGAPDHGPSDVTIGWRYVGPYEDHRHLVGYDRAVPHIAVTDSMTPLRVLARIFEVIDELADRRRLAQDCWRLVPPAELLLGVAVARGVEWDTDETLWQAANRLLLDAAAAEWDTYGRRADQRAVWRRLIRNLDLDDTASDGDVHTWGTIYLDRRATVNEALAAVQRGAPLSTREAADASGHQYGSWRSAVSRSSAPAADLDGPARWWPQTIAAYRLAHGRDTIPYLWTLAGVRDD